MLGHRLRRWSNIKPALDQGDSCTSTNPIQGDQRQDMYPYDLNQGGSPTCVALSWLKQTISH